MTFATPMAFPGSRVLAGWWRALESYQPSSLWFGYLGLHRVEGSVRVVATEPVGRMELLLLRFLQSAPQDCSPAWEQLALNPTVLFRVTNGLADKGLVTRVGQRSWALTAQGLRVLVDGNYEQVHEERQVFSFLSAADGESCHFIRLLSEPPSTVLLPWPDPHFDAAHFFSCFTQSPEWKRRHGLPENLSAVSAPMDNNGQGLLVDDPIRVALALVRTRDVEGDGGVVAFWTEPGRWVLHSTDPAFHMVEAWREVLPALQTEPAPQLWRRAWQTWCQPRDLPPVDKERCSLQLLDYRLVVRASSRLIERLQIARSDALKGEAWVLLGEGPVRMAALLEVIDARGQAMTEAGKPAKSKAK